MRGHSEALFRAVRNLIENAIRHTPRRRLDRGRGVGRRQVRVLDDGPGVPEAERESIFRRFWRRDRTKADSRGLGLAIVARVAEAHDGSVTVENRPDGGAVFTLRLRPAAGLTARKLTVAMCLSEPPQTASKQRGGSQGAGEAGMTTGTADTATRLGTRFPSFWPERARTGADRPAYREKEYGIWQSYDWAHVAGRGPPAGRGPGRAGLSAAATG